MQLDGKVMLCETVVLLEKPELGEGFCEKCVGGHEDLGYRAVEDRIVAEHGEFNVSWRRSAGADTVAEKLPCGFVEIFCVTGEDHPVGVYNAYTDDRGKSPGVKSVL
ncbi:hypothetical protein JF66_18565 [Cryobacterium sp. MLB-32]|nr:hypothetical protein JF66_18565 [Cryobacterium sp. MLB-32]